MAANDEDKHSYTNGKCNFTQMIKQATKLEEFPIYHNDEVVGFIQVDINNNLPKELKIRNKVYKRYNIKVV